MIHHFSYCRIVGNNETIKSPLFTQNIRHQPAVSSSRNSIYFIKRTHEATSSRLSSSFIRRKILIKHPVTAHVDRIIVTSGLDGTIQGKVLYTGHYLIVSFHLFSLIAFNHCLGYKDPLHYLPKHVPNGHRGKYPPSG